MAVKVSKDGLRVKLTGADYTDHKRQVWMQQGRMCASCGLYVAFAQSEFDHFAGRGMGGGKRHDTDPRNTIRHRWCHAVKHYQERDLAAVRA